MSPRFWTAIIAICSFASTFAPLILHADTPMTLKGAIREALEHNPDLKAAYHDELMASADVVTAQLRQNPTLNLIGDVLPLPGESFLPSSKYYGASISMPLDLFDHRGKRAAAAEETAAAAHETYDDNIRQTRLKVESAYWTALALRDRLELARQNLDRLTDFVRLNQLRETQQEIPAIDVTRSQFTRSQFEADVRNLSTDYHSALMALQTALGRAIFSDSLTLASDIEDIVPPDTLTPDSAVTYAFERRGDYRALLREMAADRAGAELQRSLVLPDISLSLDYSRQQYADFYGASLNFSLPIFNRNQGEIEKSGYRITQDEYQLNSLQTRLSIEIRTAFDEMLSRWQTVQQQKRDILPQAEQILKTIEYAYKIGNTTLLDYLEAQRSYTESRIAYIQTLLDYHLSQSVFETAISKDEAL